MKSNHPPPPSGVVSQALAEFKRRGSVLLVAGPAADAHAEFRRRSLAGTDSGVLVRTDGRSNQDGVSVGGDVRIVDVPAPVRGAAAAGEPIGTTSLVELNGTVRRLIETATASVSDDPSGVRLALDSLRPYVDGATDQALRSFLADVGSVARDHGAVVYIHLPAPIDAVPSALSETADAVVELRSEPDGGVQRWRLPDEAVTTEWIEI